MLEKERRRIVHVGDGVTTQFPFDFLIESLSTIVVSLYNEETKKTTPLTPGQFSVFNLGNENGGSVTITPAPKDVLVSIERTVPYKQHTSLLNQGGFFPGAVEEGLDQIVMQTQQLADVSERTIRFSPHSALRGIEIEDLVPYKFLRVSAEGDAIVMSLFDEEGLVALRVFVENQADRAEREADRARDIANATRNIVDRVAPFVERFVGDGVTTQFTLANPELSSEFVSVYMSGVYQQKNTYSVTRGVLSFSVPPPIGTIEVVEAGEVALGIAVLEDKSVTSDKITDDPVEQGLIAQRIGAVRFKAQSLTEAEQSQARGNIGLGNSATRDVGSGAGTVAAGDDPRILNAVQGNDARLSNSREWIAEVVSEVEAREGSATVPRKWTAERVAQAIESLTPAPPVPDYAAGIAALPPGGVGTYAFATLLPEAGTVTGSFGTLVAGGTLATSNADIGQDNATVLSGTWRLMGSFDADTSGSQTAERTSLWLRVA